MANVQSRRAPRMGRSNTGTVAALDIGCSKITCLIGRNDGAGPRSFRILGAGRQQSRGFTGGTITTWKAWNAPSVSLWKMPSAKLESRSPM